MPVRFSQGTIVGLAATLLIWGTGFTGQAARGQSNAPSNVQAPATPASPTSTVNPALTPGGTESKETQKGTEKEKHWSGNLVDATCMAKALSAGARAGASGATAGSSGATSNPAVPHFLSGDPAPQMGPRTGGPYPGQGPATPDQYPAGNNTDMSQPNSAQMAKAEKVDNAVKQCTATASTQTFGLALSDGQVMKFDGQGNVKASEAVKDTATQPGKKVKAKVTGTMEENDTVKVASLEVKGKRSSAPAPASSGG